MHTATAPLTDVQNPEGYHEVIVSKPWGYEYLMYDNDRVGMWHLHIDHNAQTSLHCHPRKKTGLILLSGEAAVSFLNDTLRVAAPGKLMIRPGLFHSTRALSPEGVDVIEIEAPRDKKDLVRLEDAYGREEQPYEGRDAMRPATGACLRLGRGALRPCRHRLGDCVLSVECLDPGTGIRPRPDEEIIIILEGGLMSRSGDPVLGAGDVVTGNTINRLTRMFHAPSGMTLLAIRRKRVARKPGVPA